MSNIFTEEENSFLPVLVLSLSIRRQPQGLQGSAAAKGGWTPRVLSLSPPEDPKTGYKDPIA